ncbi:MAG: hypothetical protein ABIR11_09805 [Candidatus Limnocylindrales bacterium]
MRTRIASLILGTVAAAALVVAPVAATGGSRAVTITLDVNFGTGDQVFTATGAFCPAGTAEAFTTKVSGRGSLVFHVTRTFICTGGVDTLTIDLHAGTSAQFDGTSGGWTVTGGTGAYAGASGGGQITGVNTPTGILDTYAGTVNR